MNVQDLPRLPGCGRPSTVRVEVFETGAGADRATLSAVAYGCAVHVGAIEAMLTDAGLRPVRTRYILTGRTWPCGHLIPFTAPDDAANEADVAAFFAALRVPDSVHPAWCTRQEQPDPHAVHLSAPIQVNPGEDPLYTLTLEQSYRTDRPIVLLGVFEDDDYRSYGLALPVARSLLAKLRTVLRTAGA